MADILMVAIMVGFIAVCIVYTRWCDSIIGRDDPQSDPQSDGGRVVR
jgi:hypothetical protein